MTTKTARKLSWSDLLQSWERVRPQVEKSGLQGSSSCEDAATAQPEAVPPSRHVKVWRDRPLRSNQLVVNALGYTPTPVA